MRDSSLLGRLYGPKGWTGFGAAALALFVLFPLANLVVPEGSPFHVSDYTVTLIGKMLCYAMVAVALDLVWGFGGILSLGHGLFFALGGYALGMYLMRQIGADGQYKVDMPDFMVFLDWKQFPWHWWNSDQFWWAALMVVLVPGLLAFVFGYFAFRSRIKGVYFSIITQALTYAAMLLFFRNETGFGGNNGFTDFKRIFGIPIATAETRMALFVASGAALLGSMLLVRWLVTSRYGRVLTAIRDAESRVMFCGYDPLWYKLFAWTLSAVLAGIAGALYVPQVGIINPSEMSPANSIEMVGGGRRAGHDRRPGDRRVPGQRCEEPLHGLAPRVLALRARAAVRSRDALHARRRRGPRQAVARPRPEQAESSASAGRRPRCRESRAAGRGER
jgi:urea transport system permease protein